MTVDEANDPSSHISLTGAVNQKVDDLRAYLDAQYSTIPEGISVLNYLPENPVLDGTIDYRQAFQQAVISI